MGRKFNIGDHVCIAYNSYEYDGKYRGAVGVVMYDRHIGRYGVKLAGISNNNSLNGYFYFDELSLIPQEEMNKKKDVLVGDITTGYSFVNPVEAEALRITKEQLAEEIAKHYKRMLNSTYGVSGIPFRNPKIEKVIFNNPATIVFWTDGTKTIVKCDGNEAFDEEKGLAMAISKKFLGNKGNYYNEFKKWLPTIEEGKNV